MKEIVVARYRLGEGSVAMTWNIMILKMYTPN